MGVARSGAAGKKNVLQFAVKLQPFPILCRKAYTHALPNSSSFPRELAHYGKTRVFFITLVWILWSTNQSFSVAFQYSLPVARFGQDPMPYLTIRKTEKYHYWSLVFSQESIASKNKNWMKIEHTTPTKTPHSQFTNRGSRHLKLNIGFILVCLSITFIHAISHNYSSILQPVQIPS